MEPIEMPSKLDRRTRENTNREVAQYEDERLILRWILVPARILRMRQLTFEFHKTDNCLIN